jgi:hypothetical protein
MVDTAVNSVGVGVAYAGGYVYVVQDYAQMSGTTTQPNRPPAVPTELSPVQASTLRSAPAQATARFSDPDGKPGALLFLVADDKGTVVRLAWSAVVCSGCVASASIAGLPDGIFGLYALSNDGIVLSTWSAPSVFTINHSAPLAPGSVQRIGPYAYATYNDPDGTAGWVYVALYKGSTLVNNGSTAKVCSGCMTAYPLPALAPGTYTLWAASYDGLVSPVVGPITFVV